MVVGRGRILIRNSIFWVIPFEFGAVKMQKRNSIFCEFRTGSEQGSDEVNASKDERSGLA